ncbi:MAG: hypothetical protein H6608_11730 [Flavobacteriales bacterium]|nr:hypothetical protein [Bacteroidota bacterium]MCB9241798.1 hypothetical protein [Flavobacteriales bacterium]
MKRTQLVLIFLILFSAAPNARAGYDYTLALVHVGRDQQPDSVGFNIVRELTHLIYRKVQEDRITLWDSPAKKIKIGKVALELIEQKNNIQFIDNDDIFLYETWKLYKRQFEFQILGFSFFRRLPDGNKLNLGYVDVEEAREMLGSLVIPTNANGQANLSYWSALMSKAYPFDLVKFGNKDFSAKPAMSFNIVDQAFKDSRIRSNAYKLEDVKLIEYNILPQLDRQTGNYWLFRSLNQYFEENRHEYFNLTTNPVISYLDVRSPLRVTRIEVMEIWERRPDQSLRYHPQQIRLFVNDQPMDWMPISEIERFDIIVQFKPILEFIREKQFTFTIRKINEERLFGYSQDQIIAALTNQPWNKITYKPTH